MYPLTPLDFPSSPSIRNSENRGISTEKDLEPPPSSSSSNSHKNKRKICYGESIHKHPRVEPNIPSFISDVLQSQINHYQKQNERIKHYLLLNIQAQRIKHRMQIEKIFELAKQSLNKTSPLNSLTSQEFYGSPSHFHPTQHVITPDLHSLYPFAPVHHYYPFPLSNSLDTISTPIEKDHIKKKKISKPKIFITEYMTPEGKQKWLDNKFEPILAGLKDLTKTYADVMEQNFSVEKKYKRQACSALECLIRRLKNSIKKANQNPTKLKKIFERYHRRHHMSKVVFDGFLTFFQGNQTI